MAEKAIGRPTRYSDEMVATICERLANGESLRSICRDPDMPCLASVFKWLSENPKFSEQYDRAREVQAEVLADSILDIADNGANDWMEKNDGENAGWLANGEAIQRSRLRVDARKWVASKLLPKKFGDKQELNHTGQVTHEHTISGLMERIAANGRSILDK